VSAYTIAVGQAVLDDLRDARFLVTLAPGGFEPFFAELGEPAGDATEPAPLTRPPDLAHVLAVTRRHGIEMLGGPPPGS